MDGTSKGGIAIPILSELKIIITDIWKGENIINLAIPLSIKVKFEYSKPKDLDMLNRTFYKINIIDKYFLEEFNINNSFFKIYYYGNPKKLSNESKEEKDYEECLSCQ